MTGPGTHLCPKADGKIIAVTVRGQVVGRDVFCPLCGSVVPPVFSRHRYNRAVHSNVYQGPLCGHGFPDLPCTELAALDETAGFELSTGTTVPEFAAAQLAARYGCAPELVDWVRPCPVCRRDAAVASMPVLRHAFAQVAERLYADVRAAVVRERDLREDVARLHQAARAFEEQVEARADGVRRTGFVYLIGHDDALKIGWSERHPREGRLGALQTASAKPLELFGLLVGTVGDEYELHSRFAKYRLRGEWFSRADEILAYFAEHGLDV
jgi:hypothetical protein